MSEHFVTTEKNEHFVTASEYFVTKESNKSEYFVTRSEYFVTKRYFSPFFFLSYTISALVTKYSLAVTKYSLVVTKGSLKNCGNKVPAAKNTPENENKRKVHIRTKLG